MTTDDIKGATDQASANAQAAVRHASDEAAVATSKALHEGQDAAGQASATAGDLYGRAKEQVQGLSDRLPDSASGAFQAGQRAYAQSSEHVGRHVAKTAHRGAAVGRSDRLSCGMGDKPKLMLAATTLFSNSVGEMYESSGLL